MFELKTGSAADLISKRDVDQLGGSVRWHHDQYGDDVAALPVMLHPSALCHWRATPPAGMRVITPNDLDRLKQAVRSFAVALADGLGHWKDEAKVAEQLGSLKLTGADLIAAYSTKARVQAQP